MKLLITLMAMTITTSVFANTFPVRGDCLEKITKVNEALGASFIGKENPGVVSIKVDPTGTILGDTGAATVNAQITVKYEDDVLVFDSVNTVLVHGYGCYVVRTSVLPEEK